MRAGHEISCPGFPPGKGGAMLVDTTDLMYNVFQGCRGALRATPIGLSILREALEFVRQ